MIAYLAITLGIIGLLSWCWRTDRDPLVYIVPPAVAFSPLIRYAGETFAWPGSWLSVRKALVFALGISFAFRLLKGHYAWHRIPGMAVVAPYLCLVPLSVLWSVMGPYNHDASAILNEFIDWAVPVALFLYVAASPTSERMIASTGRVMACTVVMIGLYCGFQLLTLLGGSRFVPSLIDELTRQGQQDFWWGSFRLYGPFTSLGPNSLGVFLLLPTTYAVTRFFATTRRARLGWALVCILALAVIAGTYSRAAQLGLIVALTVLPLLRRSARGLVLVAALLFLTVALVGETTIGRHFASLYGAGGTFDPDVGYRLQVWRAIVDRVPQHPFGFGFNGWARVSQHVMIPGLATLPGAPQSGAGQWMRELADRGFLGVLFLALTVGGLAFLAIRRAYRSGQQGIYGSFLTAAGAGFMAWVVVFISDDHLMVDAVAAIFWLVAGMTLAAIRDDPDSFGARSSPAPADQPCT